MKEQIHDINTLTKLKNLCQKQLLNSKRPLLYLLYGNLGSGKTAFVKEYCSQNQINQNQVKSPTFSLINVYQIPQKAKIYHLDLYRIDQVDPILLEEILEIISDPNSITMIEWADRLPPEIIQRFSGTVYHLKFDYHPGKYRRISIQTTIQKDDYN